jgi:hypothetical protein
MKASELRIGNWVKSPLYGVEYEIEFIYESPTIKEIEPIPLTEEWLLKFRFEKYYEYYVNSHLEISEMKSKKGYDAYCTDMDFSIFMTEVKYVHQLQNLYFALTGEELILNK